jgi:RNA polymerase sigma-70 factor (ECF subfamily)
VASKFIDSPDKEQAAIASVDSLPAEDDLTLVAAARGGNLPSFEVLVQRHERRVFFVARRMTRLREDAEDIVQQTFQKAFVHLHKFEGKSSFSTWLTRIAINEALMLLRKGRGSREVSIDDATGNEETPVGLEIPDSGPSPESSYSQREREKILSSSLNRLSQRTRRAIQLRELDGRSTEETAQIMGISVGAVKARVFHGRRKLRDALKRSFGSPWMSRRGSSEPRPTRHISRKITSSAMRVVKTEREASTWLFRRIMQTRKSLNRQPDEVDRLHRKSDRSQGKAKCGR